MVTVKCPKCGEEIELGKDAYNNLLNEIESTELDKRVNEKVNLIRKQLKAESDLASAKAKKAQDDEISKLKAEKVVLEQKLENVDNVVKLAISDATKDLQKQLLEKENDIVALKGDVKDVKQKAKEEQDALESNYKFLLDAKQEELERWKELRVGDSTKDIGESLERYCKEAFDEVRAVAYPYAYFEKDTKAVKGEEEEKGTEGDFIFKDYPSANDDTEIVSIMFDMKNEKEGGKTTNESHFKKLDADRNKKGCEYAVLVSTLEKDSALYNKGIVEVYKYPKMFVVRPQFFLAIIGLIRNMALKAYDYKKQLVTYQKENIDVTNFEKAVQAVADHISDDYSRSAEHFSKAEKLIDDTIAKLQNLKEEYRLVNKWIGTAQNRLPQLEVRKLVKDNPTMQEKFDALKEDK